MRRGVPTGSPVCGHGYARTITNRHPDGKPCTGGYDAADVGALVAALKEIPALHADGPAVNCEAVAKHLLEAGWRFVDPDEKHVIELGADGWTLKHPLACRAADLFACPVNAAASRTALEVWSELQPAHGRFRCVEQAGHLVLLERVP